MKPKSLLLVAAVVAASCTTGDEAEDLARAPSLTIVRERTFAELFGSDEPFEASGVAFSDGALRVVFDNRTQVARVETDLSAAALGPGGRSDSQYEGVTPAAPSSGRLYVVKEGEAARRSSIVTLDARGGLISTEPTDLVAAQTNKGVEGLAWVEGAERLLALCEANGCGDGDRRPGAGRLKVLRRDAGGWTTETTLALPPEAPFADYSDVAILPGVERGRHRIAVVSQESAALWLGDLTVAPLAVHGPGRTYRFPPSLCSVEGVTFLDARTLVLVSDRRRDADGCGSAEAVHVVSIP